MATTDHRLAEFGESEATAEVLPLTAAQRGMWFAETLSPDYSVNIAQYVDIRHEPGGLDIELLEQCCVDVGKLVEFPFVRLATVDGVPVQYVDLDFDQHVDILDMRAEADPIAAAMAWMNSEYRRPVDLINDQLIVIAIIRVADDRTLWYNRAHHIIIDGYAALSIMRRTVDRYNSLRRNEIPIDKTPATMAEIVDYEQAYQAGRRRAADRDHWLERVADLPERVTLAQSSEIAPLSFDNVVVGGQLAPELQARLDAMAGELNSSIAVLLTAAFGAFLARMTQTDDVVMSLPVTGRTTAKIKASGGMVSNVLPIRLRDVAKSSAADLIRDAQLELTGALRHQRYRSDDIRRDAGFDGGSVSFGPTINMVFFDDEVAIDGTTMQYRILTSGILEDLLINLYQSGPDAPLVVDLHGNPHLYSPAQMSIHHRRFLAFVERFIAEPDRLVSDIDLLIDGESDQLAGLAVGPRQQWTPEQIGSGRILDGYADQVRRNPDHVAISDDSRDWTYAEFDEVRRGIACRLRDAGVGVGDRVVVALPRGTDQVAAVYAVLGLGAAYVPVDLDQPAARRELVLSIARPRCVIDREFLDRPLSDASNNADRCGADLVDHSPDLPAYVIFTSGSTGTPKGVQLSHRAVVNRLAWGQYHYALTPSDTVLYKTPITFDVSVPELFAPLRVGARMVIARPDGHRDPVYLRTTMVRHNVTSVHFVPSMLSVFVDVWGDGDEPILPATVRRVFTSGESLPAPLANRVLAGSEAEVVNLYGPTEAAVEITEYVVRPGDLSIPIGRPVPGGAVRILDARLRPVPVGVPGDLYLSGVQLADGYVAATGLTAERFVADPFAADQFASEQAATTERMYRSGDLARWNDDGTVEYLGRSDFQVKIRGQRVELGDIDATLLADPDVDGAVTVVDDRPGTAVLVAYVKSQLANTTAAEELANRLLITCRRRLPSHMVPTAVTVLDAFPVNGSGKLDRKELPDTVISRDTAVEYIAPSSEVEKTIVATITDLLGIERVGLADNIFALGADSLIAARLASRLRVDSGLDISVGDIFEIRTVGELAIAAQSTAHVAGPEHDLTGIVVPEHIPLGLQQTRIWFINRMDPSSGMYNIPGAVRLGPELDRDALAAAIADLVERHQTLRTTFPDTDGEPEQVVHPMVAAGAAATLDEVDVTAGGEVARIVDLTRQGFDLVSQFPIRSTLVRVTDGDVVVDHVLVVVLHHIVADAASLNPLITDILTAYAARAQGHPPAWRPLPAHYVDYALWQREMLGADTDESSVSSREIEFWRTELDGLPPLTVLPTDRPRPATPSGTGDIVDMWLEAGIVDGLREVAARHGVTLFAVFQSALAVVLSRLNERSDVAIGTAVSGRDDARLAELIGMFVNTVVLRTHVHETDTLGALLTGAHRVRARAMSNADVPFEQVVSALGVTRSRAHSPLFQVELVMTHDQIGQVFDAHPGLGLIDTRVRAAKYDLSASVVEYGDAGPHANQISIELCYATDLFDRPTITRLAGFLRTVLGSMADSGPRMPMVADLLDFTGTENDAVRSWSQGAAVDVPGASFTTELFDRVAATPHAPALVEGSRVVDYQEFGARVDHLARELMSIGVGPEVAVGVCLPRSVELLVAVHAVLAAGAYYVALDPQAPAERTGYMIETSGMAIVLVPAGQPVPESLTGRDDLTVVTVNTAGPTPELHAAAAELPGRAPMGASAAYTLFTSGSTGRPKGVVVSRAAIVNRIAWMQAHYPLSPADVVLHKTPVTFDVSVWELFWPLMTGSCLVLAEPGRHGDPEYLADLIEERRVSVLHFVPSMLSTFIDVLGTARLEDMSALRTMFTSGEALTPATAQRVLRALPAIGLHNLYGPTEVAVDVTEHRVAVDEPSVPIGRPVWNTTAHVLDWRLRPVPTGVPGELYLGGVQVARGYAGRAALTAERFVADPFGSAGARLYRTGDLVKWSNSGELEYLGRNDFQVKLRGQRIELGEVEAAVASVPGVVHTAATVAQVAAADHLVAYFSPDDLDLGVVQQTVAQRLPEYMRPSIWMPLPTMPLSTAGKVDRKRLPAPTASTGDYVAPQSPMEEAAATVFADVLGLESVSVQDSFFALGGNSLSATKVAARLSAVLDRNIGVSALFDAPTVRQICEFAATNDARRRPPITARAHGDRGPVSSLQRGMWLINQADTDSPAYNVAMALRLRGSLDRDGLRRAIEDLVDRHESLRTRYPMIDGEIVQVVMSRDAALDEIERRYVELASSRDHGDLENAIAAVAGRGFDVTRRPPVRLAVLALSPTEHILILVIHHIAADGSSMAPLARDVMTSYGSRSLGRRPQWQPLRVHYLDFALWQQNWLNTRGADGRTEEQRQLDYWIDRLAGAPKRLELPTDRLAPRTRSFVGAEVEFTVPDTVIGALEVVARENNATLFMVMHAAFAVLLGRLSGARDVVIGTPYGGRADEELDDMVGMFVNTLALRTTLRDDEKFSELLNRVRDHDVADMGNADVAFETVASAVVGSPDASYNPIYQVMFAFQNFTMPALELPDLTVEPVSEQLTSAKVDLQLTLSANDSSVTGQASGMKAQLIYAVDVFDEKTVDRYAQRYLRVLEVIADDPRVLVGDIAITTDAEETAALAQSVEPVALPALVGRAALAAPDSVAAAHDGQTVTFAALSAMTTAMAAALPDQDSALTTALMSLMPGVAAGGPEVLGAVLTDLRTHAAAAVDNSAEIELGGVGHTQGGPTKGPNQT